MHVVFLDENKPIDTTGIDIEVEVPGLPNTVIRLSERLAGAEIGLYSRHALNESTSIEVVKPITTMKITQHGFVTV